MYIEDIHAQMHTHNGPKAGWTDGWRYKVKTWTLRVVTCFHSNSPPAPLKHGTLSNTLWLKLHWCIIVPGGIRDCYHVWLHVFIKPGSTAQEFFSLSSGTVAWMGPEQFNNPSFECVSSVKCKLYIQVVILKILGLAGKTPEVCRLA